MNRLQGKKIQHPLQQDEVTYIQTVSEGGKKSVLDIVMHPMGAGPPLHYHKHFSEKFEIMEGELMVQVGKQTHKLKAGDKVTVPIGELHRFWSESENPTKFQVTIEPGHEGFENTLAITYGLAKDGLTSKKGIPKKFAHIAILATMSDTNSPGFFSLIFGFLRYYAGRKNSQRIQQALIEQYCM